MKKSYHIVEKKTTFPEPCPACPEALEGSEAEEPVEGLERVVCQGKSNA